MHWLFEDCIEDWKFECFFFQKLLEYPYKFSVLFIIKISWFYNWRPPNSLLKEKEEQGAYTWHSCYAKIGTYFLNIPPLEYVCVKIALFLILRSQGNIFWHVGTQSRKRVYFGLCNLSNEDIYIWCRNIVHEYFQWWILENHNSAFRAANPRLHVLFQNEIL